MGAAELYLVRHAQAAGRDDDDPGLSERGGHRHERSAPGSPPAPSPPCCTAPAARRGDGHDRLVLPGADRGRVLPLLDDRTPVPSDERRDEYPRRYHQALGDVPAQERDVDAVELREAVSRLVATAEEQAALGPLLLVTHAFVIGWFVRSALETATWRWIGLELRQHRADRDPLPTRWSVPRRLQRHRASGGARAAQRRRLVREQRAELAREAGDVGEGGEERVVAGLDRDDRPAGERRPDAVAATARARASAGWTRRSTRPRRSRARRTWEVIIGSVAAWPASTRWVIGPSAVQPGERGEQHELDVGQPERPQRGALRGLPAVRDLPEQETGLSSGRTVARGEAFAHRGRFGELRRGGRGRPGGSARKPLPRIRVQRRRSGPRCRR